VVTAEDAAAPELDDLRSVEPAIDLPRLEEILTRTLPVADWLTPHPEVPGAWLLRLDGAQHGVSFRRDVADDNPARIELLTYGTALFDRLLKAC
jgi:hypothetical protein